MAIPEKPLELNVDPDDLTLDEMALFSKKGFDWYDFRQFLIDHSVNWTPEEIGKIKIGELEVVGEQVSQAATKVAVPLANLTRSKTGPGLKAKQSHHGRSKSSTPKNLDATPKTLEEP